MTLGIVEAVRHTRLSAISTAVDAGTSNGVLVLYTTARPATGGAATTEVATLAFGDPAFAAPSGGTMAANTIADDTNATGGVTTWFRVADSNDGATPNNAVLDGDVGTSGSDLNLNSTTISAAATVSVSQFDLTDGNA